MDLLTIQNDFVEAYRTNIHRTGSDKLLNWICEETDFLSMPAGAKHHSAFPGGLAVHSLNVYRRLLFAVAADAFGSARREDIQLLAVDVRERCAILGLLHDLCKHDVYHEKEDGGYEFKDPFPLGHGEKSVYLINQFMRLSPEEALAIRWHMGAYDSAAIGDGFKALSAAQNVTPWVWRLHRADMDATKLDEV